MPDVQVTVKTNWLNGWFIKIFSKPFLWVDGNEIPVEFSSPALIKIDNYEFKIGAGIRYFSKGRLLGCDPETIYLDISRGDFSVVLKNGFWNHSPFSVLNAKGSKKIVQE
ncbi:MULTISPECIES: hypothetical protein [Bacillati]|uniref:hypothetical protein n=1 Tax=Bacillati TaxID=1783272 RepID=UPI0011799DE1|nr:MULTISPECIES: hypothetical protein [Rothia]MDO4252908.1 hypothetical protein [Rothia sp. (in: high G+C Gram-positive bacteria)]